MVNHLTADLGTTAVEDRKAQAVVNQQKRGWTWITRRMDYFPAQRFFHQLLQRHAAAGGELSRAFELIDEMFEVAGNPAATLDCVKKRGGHFPGSYLRLLRFLADHRSGLNYSWAEPNFSSAHKRALAENQTQPLIEVLSGVSNLMVETITISGELSKADVKNGTWKIATEDGMESGSTTIQGPSLAGLQLSSRYRFTCREEIAEIDGSGREKRSLFLISYEGC